MGEKFLTSVKALSLSPANYEFRFWGSLITPVAAISKEECGETGIIDGTLHRYCNGDRKYFTEQRLYTSVKSKTETVGLVAKITKRVFKFMTFITDFIREIRAWLLKL